MSEAAVPAFDVRATARPGDRSATRFAIAALTVVVVSALLANVADPSNGFLTSANAALAGAPPSTTPAPVTKTDPAASSQGLHFATESTDGATLAIPAVTRDLFKDAMFYGRGNSTPPKYDSLKARPPMAIYNLSLEDIATEGALETLWTVAGYYYLELIRK